MDFYTLSRKQLQALCKNNKIPANLTNLAMAESLSALPQVEGLDEILSSVEIGTPDVRRTASKTSGPRKDVNVPATPAAMPSSRRRAPLTSTRRMKEVEMPEVEKNGGQGKLADVPVTPAAPTTRTRAYNTRRSVRLLEKSLSRMNMLESEDMGSMKVNDVSEDISNSSQQTGISAENEKNKTDESEVTSQEKNTEIAEAEDSNMKLEASCETYNETSEVCDKKEGKAVLGENEAESGLLFDFEDSYDSTKPENVGGLGTKQDVCTEVSEDAPMEVTNPDDVAAFGLSVEIPNDASKEITGQDTVGLSNEVSDDAGTEFFDQAVAALTVEVPVCASVEATDGDISGLLPVSSVSNNSVIVEGLVACNTDKHDDNDSAEISALSVESEDASMEATDQDVAAFSVDVTDQDVAAFSVDVTALSAEVSVTSMSSLRSNTDTPVDSDVVLEEIAVPKQESSISVETMTVAPIHKQVEDAADKGIVDKAYVMKENTNSYESKSMRELKKMLKNLKLDGKSNGKINNNVAKEADRKRTALQDLPENRMTAGGVTENDG